MNYQQRMRRIKKKIGTRGGWGFLRRMKKVRGKVNRRNVAVKIHSVSDVDFVLSTSYATYKIPRSYGTTFGKATQRQIENVVGFMSYGYDYSIDAVGHFLSFYWYDLDDVFDIDQFEKFKVAEGMR